MGQHQLIGPARGLLGRGHGRVADHAHAVRRRRLHAQTRSVAIAAGHRPRGEGPSIHSLHAVHDPGIVRESPEDPVGAGVFAICCAFLVGSRSSRCSSARGTCRTS